MEYLTQLSEELGIEPLETFHEYKPDTPQGRLIQRLIERAQSGNPPYLACLLALHCGYSDKWAEGVIERADVGFPSYPAWLMVRDGNSDREWAEDVIRQKARDYIETPVWVARMMVDQCGSSPEFIDEIAKIVKER